MFLCWTTCLFLLITFIGVRLLSNVTSVGESDGAVTLTLVSSFPSNDSFTVQVFTMDREEMTANSMSIYILSIYNTAIVANSYIHM